MNASDEKPRKGDTGYLAIAIGVLIVILFIGFGWYFSGQPGPAQQAPMTEQAATPQESADGKDATAAERQGTEQQQAALQPQDQAAQDSAQEPADKDTEPTVAEVVPTFDTIRIEPNGDTVIAGQAAPGANVTLYANSQQIATATADAGGNWAMVLDKPLAAGNSDLWVSAEKGGDAVRSEQQLAVVIDPEGKSTPLVVVQDGSGSRVMQEPEQVASADDASPDRQDKTGTGGDRMAMAPKDGAMSNRGEAGMPQGTTSESAPDGAAGAAATGGESSAKGNAVGAATTSGEGSTGSGTAEERMASRTGGQGAGAQEGSGQQPAARSDPGASAGDGQDEANAPVRIEAADYDDEGNLYISGRAAPGATIRLYYDNELLGDATAGENGRWSLTTQRPLDGKVHTLRGDQLEPGSGQVAGRAEVSLIAQIPGEPPPQPGGEERRVADAGGEETATDTRPGSAPLRDDATDIAGDGGYSGGPDKTASSGEADGQNVAAATESGNDAQSTQSRLFTVQRGDNLWRIARDYYGRGIRYTTIFEANKDQIRDPDLIYPDQVFLIPRRVEGHTASN